MEWYIIDKKYVDYLRGFDSRVQRADYGEFMIKPFLGIVFSVNDVKYCVPVSSPKPNPSGNGGSEHGL